MSGSDRIQPCAPPAPRIKLPGVDQLLRSEGANLLIGRHGRQPVVNAIRRTLDDLRKAAKAGAKPVTDAAGILRSAERLIEDDAAPSLKRVFNLTGTVLHTNLGRAALPDSAIAAVIDTMRSAVALEFALGEGARGERDDHVRGLLRELTGAEDACIVNNNAAAVLLVLNTLGLGRQAIVSRGELIEIGGSFRLPDIMARAGARLVEVGTTNRTHFKDYEQALNPETGVILKAHTSNYRIQGFTTSVSAPELSALARKHGVPFVHDLGSGALVDMARYGLTGEPTVRQSLEDGADLVTFSGDKLLGGPQAGIVAGARDLVARVAGNPMKRALRVDKMRLAALEATLKLYRDPGRLPELLPTLRYFTRSRENITAAASRLAPAVAAAVGSAYAVTVVACASQIGSGALPLETLPSAGLSLRPIARKGDGRALEKLSLALRGLAVPVIGRIHDRALLLDLRCLDDETEFTEQLPTLRKMLSAEGGVDG